MRPQLSPRTLLFCTFRSFSSSFLSSPLLQISDFATCLHYSSHSIHSGRRQEEESRNVRVSVWWDFENCNLPAGVNVFKVAQMITTAVRSNGVKGPVTITAFGDVLQLSRAKQEALSSTGINITHVPHGGKNSADRSLLVDLMYWVSQNPPPAHLFLISGDRDFASILHRLRMNNYNILLASPESAPGVLCSAASIMWPWDSLIRGENLTGKHFNQPPDGPYNSWYGHSKVPLEDPFLLIEQPACSRAEDTPEAGSDSKPRAVPKILMKLIRSILNSHPEGISITELRSELGKSNLSIDKDFYGYKKFSRFLLSMPQILKLQPEVDGQFVVRGITPKTPEPFESTVAVSTGPASNNGFCDLSATSKSNDELRASTGAVNGEPSFPTYSKSNVKGPLKGLQEPSPLGRSIGGAGDEKSAVAPSPEINSEALRQHSPLDEKVVEQLKEGHSPPVVKQDSGSEVGFFKRVFRKWFGRSDGDSMKNESQRIPEKCSTSGATSSSCVSSEEKSLDIDTPVNDSKIAKINKFPKSTSLDVNPICMVACSSANEESAIDSKTATSSEAYGDKSRTSYPICNVACSSANEESAIDNKTATSSEAYGDKSRTLHPICKVACSSANEESAIDSKIATSSEAYGDKSRTSPGFFNRMVNWYKIWRSNTKSDILSDQSRENMDQMSSRTEKHKLFSNDSFWSDMESFMGTPNGSVMISQSRTREQLAQNLQKEGPPALKSLSEIDLLHLVDLLISEVKWVEECHAQTSPFKLTWPAGKSSLTQSRSSNGLSSIFLNKTSLSSEPDGERKYQNISHAGVSPHVINRKPSVRSRSDILADCQKLLNEILKDYPEGYNMGYFRKIFLKRYGYPLDIQKLGYLTLVSLLQTMPGVKIESNYIFPSGKASVSSGLEIAVPHSVENHTGHSVANSDSELSDSAKKDDDSDSPWEELGPIANTSFTRNEMVSVSRSKGAEQLKRQKYPDYEPSFSDDDSSDSEEISTLSGREGQGKRINEGDSSLLLILDSWYSTKEGDNRKSNLQNVDGLKQSAHSAVGINGETSMGKYERKQRPQKIYSFVSDPVENNKDKLLDGILGTLKKTGESSVQG